MPSKDLLEHSFKECFFMPTYFMDKKLYIHPYRPAACIKVEGEDAPTFLQSQFSNDLKTLTSGTYYGLWLTPKGKVAADSFVFNYAPNTYYLLSYFSKASAIIDKLESNLIADDVYLKDETALFTAWSILGEDALAWVQELLPEPSFKEYIISNNYFVFKGRRSLSPSFEIIVKQEEGHLSEKIQTLLKNQPKYHLSSQALESQRISDKIPAIPIDIGPSDLPQEGGLEASCISFSKGCYVGQEVMARLKAMGNPQRSLCLLKAETPCALMPTLLPAPLYIENKQVGEMRCACALKNGYQGLGLLKKRYIKNEGLLSTTPLGKPEIRVLL